MPYLRDDRGREPWAQPFKTYRMPLLNSLVSWLTIKRLNQIDLFRKYPHQVQMEVLQGLLRQGARTSFGRAHGLEPSHELEQFRARVPIRDYDGLKPYVDRLLKGEKSVLWPSDIKWFAKSSGTTSDRSKFIPVSREALEKCHFRGAKDVLVLYSHNHPDSKLYAGKGLTLGGSHQINNISNDSYFGDLSAVLIQNTPFWAHFIRTPDLSIALMDEWESKIERMAQATINQNVTSISGVPSWTLTLIKRIFEITGKSDLHDIWPRLELFIHGGVSFVPYRDEFRRVIPSGQMRYLETYNASEGFFAIQDDPASDSMLLMLDYDVFYEFVPMDQLGLENPQALALEEVRSGVNYAMVITTNGGLWRYMIGDTVMFTSTNPYKIKITGRTKYFINAFGEEIIEDNAREALRVACERTQASLVEYTAAPIYKERGQTGGHQWLIEFERLPESLDRFADLLDLSLKAVNSDYEAKRYKDLTLGPPRVVVARPGLFYDWLKRKGKLGGQHKVPRLANHRDFMDELLALNAEA